MASLRQWNTSQHHTSDNNTPCPSLCHVSSRQHTLLWFRFPCWCHSTNQIKLRKLCEGTIRYILTSHFTFSALPYLTERTSINWIVINNCSAFFPIFSWKMITDFSIVLLNSLQNNFNYSEGCKRLGCKCVTCNPINPVDNPNPVLYSHCTCDNIFRP
jgi:hypothetical protein